MKSPGRQVHIEALVAEIVPLPVVARFLHQVLEDYLFSP